MWVSLARLFAALKHTRDPHRRPNRFFLIKFFNIRIVGSGALSCLASKQARDSEKGENLKLKSVDEIKLAFREIASSSMKTKFPSR